MSQLDGGTAGRAALPSLRTASRLCGAPARRLARRWPGLSRGRDRPRIHDRAHAALRRTGAGGSLAGSTERRGVGGAAAATPRIRSRAAPTRARTGRGGPARRVGLRAERRGHSARSRWPLLSRGLRRHRPCLLRPRRARNPPGGAAGAREPAFLTRAAPLFRVSRDDGGAAPALRRDGPARGIPGRPSAVRGVLLRARRRWIPRGARSPARGAARDDGARGPRRGPLLPGRGPQPHFTRALAARVRVLLDLRRVAALQHLDVRNPAVVRQFDPVLALARGRQAGRADPRRLRARRALGDQGLRGHHLVGRPGARRARAPQPALGRGGSRRGPLHRAVGRSHVRGRLPGPRGSAAALRATVGRRACSHQQSDLASRGGTGGPRGIQPRAWRARDGAGNRAVPGRRAGRPPRRPAGSRPWMVQRGGSGGRPRHIHRTRAAPWPVGRGEPNSDGGRPVPDPGAGAALADGRALARAAPRERLGVSTRPRVAASRQRVRLANPLRGAQAVPRTARAREPHRSRSAPPLHRYRRSVRVAEPAQRCRRPDRGAAYRRPGGPGRAQAAVRVGAFRTAHRRDPGIVWSRSAFRRRAARADGAGLQHR